MKWLISGGGGGGGVLSPGGQGNPRVPPSVYIPDIYADNKLYIYMQRASIKLCIYV